MKTPSRTVTAFGLGGIALGATLLTGCSSGTSSGGATSTPSASSTELTQEQHDYCAAVTTWGSSVAAANLKAANATGDPAKVRAAMKAYEGQTQDMVDSVPADAPANVKKAYAAVNTVIKNGGEGKTVTQQQSAAEKAGLPIITAYYAKICN